MNPATEPTPAATKPALHSILYIDDEPHSLTAFKLSFESDFRIFTASDTESGYRILKENEIQLIVTDQRMPDESGVKFLNRIRDEFPKTVRTILTGYSDIEAILEAINECHIYYYFKKPWNEEELKLAFRNAIEVSQLSLKNEALVHELKRAMGNLEEQKEQLAEQLVEREKLVKILEETSEAKSSFLSVVSHELRTPLNPIIGMSDMLTRTTQEPDTRANLELINRCGHELLGMINSIMSFVQEGSKPNTPILDPIDLSILLHDAHKLAQTTLLRDTPVEVTQTMLVDGNPSQERYQITSNPEALHQVLNNLVTNACKFTESGKIAISMNLNKKDNQLEISVEDTGIGIAADDLSRIFEKFTQVDDSLSRHYSGMGLGLAICKQAIKNLEGTIDVESELGQGSVFKVRIPLTESPTLLEEKESSLPTGPLGPVNHCLIAVPDNQESALLGAILKKAGATFETVHDSQSARKAITQTSYDFVFVDSLLTDEDGQSLVEKLAQTQTEGSFQLVALFDRAEGPNSEPQELPSSVSRISQPYAFEDFRKLLHRPL